MKHISEIIRSTYGFGDPQEKGSREWSMFDTIQGDTVSMFETKTRPQSKWPRYPNTVHIHRYPRHQFLQTAYNGGFY